MKYTAKAKQDNATEALDLQPRVFYSFKARDAPDVLPVPFSLLYSHL